jgi:hypothetical protein
MFMPSKEVRRCSVDFGNVLLENFSKEAQAEASRMCVEDGGCDSPRIREFLLKTSRLVADSLRGLKILVDRYGKENVFIVSRVDREAVEINKLLIKLNGICEKTGLLEANIVFVERLGDKVEVCENLGIFMHIDDRGEVFSHMCSRIPRLFWFNPSPKDLDKWSVKLGMNVVRVSSWEMLIPLLG